MFDNWFKRPTKKPIRNNNDVVNHFRVEYFREYQAIKRSHPAISTNEMASIARGFLRNA